MKPRSLRSFRRNPERVADPLDNVIAESVNMRCTGCGATWSARLGVFRDEIEAADTVCPTCGPDQLPPAAA